MGAVGGWGDRGGGQRVWGEIRERGREEGSRDGFWTEFTCPPGKSSQRVRWEGRRGVGGLERVTGGESRGGGEGGKGQEGKGGAEGEGRVQGRGKKAEGTATGMSSCALLRLARA